MDIREVQARTWANKQAKGLASDDVPYEFALAYGELAEAFDAWRKDPAKLGEELADVMIYLSAIAAMNGIDLDSAVEAKLAVNEARSYVRGTNGTLIKEEG